MPMCILKGLLENKKKKQIWLLLIFQNELTQYINTKYIEELMTATSNGLTHCCPNKLSSGYRSVSKSNYRTVKGTNL